MNLPAASLKIARAVLESGHLAEAERLYRQILKQDRRNPEALLLLARTLARSGQVADAIASMRKLILIVPDRAAIFAELGNLCVTAGDAASAARYHQRAAELEPNHPDYLANAAMALSAVGDHSAAVRLTQKALQLRPDHAVAWNTLGLALKSLGDLIGASEAFRRSVERNPRFFVGWANLSQVLADIGDLDEAMLASRAALPLNPVAQTPNHLLLGLYNPRITPAESAQEHFRCATELARQSLPAPISYANERAPGRRLRIGYVSADFRQHAVATFLEPLLANHDHAQFEIYAYSNSAAVDSVTSRLMSHADHWRQIQSLSDERAAEQIHEDQIDILIDLGGHTTGNRLSLFAARPAPIQFTYLGYPATTGLQAIDYRLTDAFCDPPGQTESLHSEQLIRLSNSFLTFQPPVEAGPISTPVTNDSGSITFGSFNIMRKITPWLIELWSRVLQRVPRSRLMIKAQSLQSAEVRKRLLDRFAACDIGGDRIELIARTPDIAAHLELYGRVDIALDPFPYHGTTTSCEALWMGVPLITLAGSSHVSRVGVSLLSNLGLPELIATTPDDYIRIAAELAGDGERRAALRETLRARMRASPLMNAAAVACNIESAYRNAWQTWITTHPDS